MRAVVHIFKHEYICHQWATGTIPEIWSHGKIMPIYKNSGNSTDPNNYRPISILSCLGKLFTALLSERLNTFMEVDEILKENQAGFRKHYSTTDHIFSLYSLLEILKYEKKKSSILLIYRFIKSL